MHYSGNIIRPPHEGKNVLLQVTTGCSHNRCRFCGLYRDIGFRMSPMREIEADLREVRRYYPRCNRIFLLAADAFVMTHEKLKAIAEKINQYLPDCATIAMYASVRNVMNKTVEQLADLRAHGVDKLTMGIESGDDDVLVMSNKGYTAKDIVEQCGKLDDAGIAYSIIYIGGLAGRGKGVKNALESAKVFNQINPTHIGAMSLTLMPGSELYEDALAGRFVESGELERTEELLALVSNLDIRTFIAANHVSNNIVFKGRLPTEKARIVAYLEQAIKEYDEDFLRRRRENLSSL